MPDELETAELRHLEHHEPVETDGQQPQQVHNQEPRIPLTFGFEERGI